MRLLSRLGGSRGEGVERWIAMVDRSAVYKGLFPAFFALLKHAFLCVYYGVYNFVVSHPLLVLAVLAWLLLARLVRLYRWVRGR
jgi:hypothetical protein